MGDHVYWCPLARDSGYWRALAGDHVYWCPLARDRVICRKIILRFCINSIMHVSFPYFQYM